MSLEAARDLLQRGFKLVPVRPRSKQPAVPGWTDLRLIEADLPRHFPEGQNVGVLLGEPSGWIVDVDIDDDDALAIADQFLPPTEMEWGRESRPRSHRLYRVSSPVKTKRGFARTQVELRATGTQTIAPGSVHPSGEVVRWDKDGDPAQVTPEELIEGLRRLGAATQKLRTRRELVKRAASVAALGTRNDVGFRLARDLRDAKVPLEDARSDMISYAVLVPQHEAGQYTEAEALASLEQAYSRQGARSSTSRAPVSDDDTTERARVIDLSTVVPEEVRWLCPGCIPLGKVSLLAGDPGLGKSMIALDIAAAVSQGRTWRHGGEGICGDVAILSAEDGPADTILPRLLAAGADPRRIALIDGIDGPRGDRDLDLDRDLQHLRTVVAHLNACRLVIIDPVTAYWGQADAWREADVRRVLRALGRLAAEAGVAVLCVAHLNKRIGLNAVGRIGGSIGLPAAARVVQVVIRDPDDPERRLLLPAKNNLGPDQTGLAYRIADGEGTASLRWERDPVTSRLDDILARSSQPEAGGEARREAGNFIREALKDGPIPSNQLRDGVLSAGFSEATYRRARKELGVIAIPGREWGAGLPGVGAQLRICASDDPAGTPWQDPSQSEREGAA